MEIKRRKTRKIYVGDVPVGGDAPITVQSMANTKTEDVKATIEQIKQMQEAGVDITRVSCPTEESTKALKEIVKNVNVPVVADIHFHYKRAIEAAKNGAACLRINPGNIGSMEKVREVIKAAKDYNCSIRIGVNGGSLEKELLKKYNEPCADAMVESAMNQAKMLEDNDFREFKISVKASDMLMTVEAYKKLSKVCDYPLHLGITEAGGLRTGTVKSSLGIGNLLLNGIGDTLRVSLSAGVTEEIAVGYEILRALGIRHRGIKFVSCPTCSRKGMDVIGFVSTLEQKLSHISKEMTIALMGCVVNGPGEAREADIAVVGGGKEDNILYIDGKKAGKVKDKDVVSKVCELAEEKANKD